MSTIGRATIEVGADASGFQADTRRQVEPALAGIGRSMTRWGDSISNVGSSLTRGITLPAVGAATAGAGIVAALGWGRLKSVDSAQAQLRGLGYSTEDVNRITNQLSDDLSDGMMTMAQATFASANAMAAGVQEGDELRQYIQMLDAATVGGTASFDEMQRMFARVADEGHLSSEMFRQIGQRMPGFRQAVEEATGKSGEALTEMLNNGEFTLGEFLDVMESHGGDMATEYAKTWEGMVQNTKNWVGIIGETLLSGVFEQSKEALSEFIDYLSSDEVLDWAEEMSVVIGDAFSNIVEKVQGAIEWFMNLDGSIQKIILAFAGIAVAAGPALLAVGKIVSVAGKLTTAFATLKSSAIGVWIGKLAARFGLTSASIGKLVGIGSKLLGWVGLAVGAFVLMWQNSENLRTAMGNLGTTLMEAGQRIWEALQPLADLVGEVLFESFDGWGEKIGEVAGWLGDVLAVAIEDYVIPAIEWLTDAIVGVIEWFTSLGDSSSEAGGKLAAAWEWIQEAVGAVVDWFQTHVGPLLSALWENISTSAMDLYENGIKPAWDFIQDRVQGALDFFNNVVVPVWQTVWEGLKETFSNVWENIKTVLSNVLTFIETQLAFWTAVVQGDWGAAWDAMKEAFAAGWEVIKSIFVGVWDFITDILSTGLEGLKTLWNTGWDHFVEKITAIWDSITSWVSEKWNSLSETVTGGLDTLQASWQAGWDGFTAILSVVWGMITTAVSTAWTALSSLVSTGLSTLSALWSTIWGGIQTAASVVWNGIRAAISGAWNGIQSLISSGLSAVSSLWSSVWGAISSFATSLWNGLRSAASSFINGVRSVISSGMSAIQSVFSSIWNAIKSLISSVLSSISSTVSSVWSSISSTISSVMSSISSTISSIWSSIVSAISSFMSSISSTISSIWSSIVSAISGFMSSIFSSIQSAWNNVVSTVQTAVGNVLSAVTSKFGEVVSFVGGIPGKLVSALGDLGSLFLDSGRKLIGGLVDGIKGAFGNARQAVSDGLGTLRNLLPFSPAKEGPFSGRGYTLYSGEALIEDFAKGIENQESALKKSMAGVLSNVQDTIKPNMDITARTLTAPGRPPLPRSQSRSGPDQGSTQGGGNVIYKIEIGSMTVDSDRRVKQIAQELHTRASRRSRSRGQVNLGGAVE